jgi:hypothetical protein
MLKQGLAKCEVPAYARRASVGKLAPLLGAEPIGYFDSGGSQRRVA